MQQAPARTLPPSAAGDFCNREQTTHMSKRAFFTILVLLSSAAAHAQVAMTFNIDTTTSRRRIDPRIYGLSLASAQQLADLNVPLNRSGGNADTRYNWQLNASNRAFDYYFESIGESSAVAGELTDTFITNSKSAGAQPMVTIGIIGWAAKLGPNRSKLASYSIAKYGAQTDADWQWMPDAGNGVRASDGTQITNNDPHDANTPIDALYQKSWVQHIVSKFGPANANGLRYYILDNEHSIWFSTHRDVHPVGPTMDEVWSKMLDHAQRIKEVDANALVVGPEEWGWSAYTLSGYDQQWSAAHSQWSNTPDRVAHGGMDYMPWLLAQFNDYQNRTGQRLLDIFTLHYYPQGGEYDNPDFMDVSTAMQQRRNRSTRSLWDPTYTDETWISDKVQLIPRMRDWVDTYYPGTQIGITEYNWGAENHINGATTQADIFGIFGREGLDLATRWTTPPNGSPVYNSIKMYRNYDGAKSTFGDVGVIASNPNPNVATCYAAVRSSDNALTIMLINKETQVVNATVSAPTWTSTGNAARYELKASPNAITKLADVVPANKQLTLALPAQSITLLVFPGTTETVAPAINVAGPVASGGGNLTFSGNATDETAISRVTYVLKGATNATGTATAGGGSTATNLAWSAPIKFNTGLTRVKFTAYDAQGNNTSWSTVVVQSAWTPNDTSPRKRVVAH